MRFYFDTEFLDDGIHIDLISIGIVTDDLRELYMVSSEFDDRRLTPDHWLRTHVLNHIPANQKKHRRLDIAREVSHFLEDCTELWGWYCAYDWVVLCQLFGPMVDRPKHFPKLAHDVKQRADAIGFNEKISKSGFTRHNALDDARWVRHAYQVTAWHGSK